MTESPVEPVAPARWLHLWAVLTVCATLALLVVGSLVTTRRAGMAEKTWPTHPLHLAREDYVEGARREGYAPVLYLIEHSHRAAGYLVGCCAIVLAAGLWLGQRRRWLAWLGTAALLGVIIQGLLGGFRVLLNARLGTDLATVHGCFAQIVLALLVSVALLTSRTWWTQGEAVTEERGSLRRLTLFLVLLVFSQIVFGAIVRHSYLRLAQRLHFLFAFAVVVAGVWLFRTVRERKAGRPLIVAASVLVGLLGVQVLLGVEAWMMRFGMGVLPELVRETPGQVIVRTLHFALGSLIFSTSVVLALLAHRPQRAAYPALTGRLLEGAA
jgi:heme a synthase